MRYTAQKIDGILLLDKPLHLTSNAALQRVKRLFYAKKAGHTGSLDPLATGMLPICFGEATKFSQFLLESDKCYEVVMQLGVKTTTGDAEGDVVSTQSVPSFSTEKIEAVLQQFIGAIQQIPPMFSAVKINGKPLYTLARQGIEIKRDPRTIIIHKLALKDFSTDQIALEVHCSKGTYIRTLVEDIGDVLGCGAYVISLRRPKVLPYTTDTLVTFEQLEEIVQQSIDSLKSLLLPIESSVKALPFVQLSSSSVFYLKTGQSVMVPHLPKHGLVRLYSENEKFLGVGKVLGDGRVTPERLISNI